VDHLRRIGSGKTHGTQQWLERHGAIRVRSDIERKRLYGLPLETPTPEARKADIYSSEASHRTYERLAALARLTLNAGFPTIVDATFLRCADRETFRQLAAECKASFGILAFEAPPDELARRIQRRVQAGNNASDADAAVLKRQLAEREDLGTDERRLVVGCPE